MGHGKSFIQNVRLTTVRVHRDDWSIEAVNDAEHLICTEFEPIAAPVTGSGQAKITRRRQPKREPGSARASSITMPTNSSMSMRRDSGLE